MRYRRLPFPALGPSQAHSDSPARELNTTPLIDVMLVLLVMFILTIPVATHQVPLELPRAGPEPAPAEPLQPRRLDIDRAGALRLDGRPLPDRLLPAVLARLGPGAELHLRADAETRYERFDQVLAAVKRAGIGRIGMVGNERFAEIPR